MPKIDPSQLLDCLDSLLGCSGGIKGETEVIRLAVLMTKFSKKLVSKCIYILILKNTESDLLAKFMAEGGWALVFQWLDEGICNNNYPLIREILELILICPISLDRLKENNCAKVVKGLLRDSECEEVKRLAGQLVEQWLDFIKSGQAAESDVSMTAVSSPIAVLPSGVVVSSVKLNSASNADVKKPTLTRKIAAKPGIQIVHKVTAKDEVDEDANEEDEEEVVEEDEIVPPIGSLPLYKITVLDGKSVLAKVGSKTLTLPVKKTTNKEIDSSGVTSVVLKSDPITKKFRYVAKSVSEKEKSNAGERISDGKNIQKSISISSENLSKPKILILPEKNEVKKVEEVKTEKISENKTKHVNLKSDIKEKSKDNQIKVSKSGRDNENVKSESKHKDKEKKSSRDSEKEKKRSEHKSHKSEKSRDRERDRDRDRDKDKTKKKERESSRDKHKDNDRDKEKSSKEKENKAEKVLSASEKAQIQADKDKNTLERLKTPAISLLGKIPKKSSSQLISSSEKPVNNSPVNKPSESSEDSGNDGKKLSESRTPKVRPKTVKTFNSKFRSTGLEEEIKPPPPRSSIKKKLEEKRPLPPKPDLSKSSTITTKDGAPPDKRAKIGDITLDTKKDKILEKAGGIKLIPPKPKPALLESDMFSDALTASTKLEPRKRKRRISSSKEAPEPKKEAKEENANATSPEITSPKDVKPALKFYRDTLEDDEEKNKENARDVSAEPKAESDSEDSSKQTSSGESQDGAKPGSRLYPNGVLVCKTKKGPKKTVKWKEDAELTSIRLFELDETERVNVTRTFVDMKLMERTHEREAFQLARKLATEDTMEERIPWGPLYEVEIPPERRSTVEPGKSSLEKNIQYSREKTVLQAIYFHRSLIPDSPAEPDAEIHPATNPTIIPLDDITGNNDSICNFQNIPWPEPKPTIVPSSPPPGQQMGPHNQQHQQQVQHPQGFPPGYSSAGNFPGFPQMGMPGIIPPGQNNWRPADGKELGMNMPFQPNGPVCPQMGQPPNMFNPGGPEGYMNGPPMGGFNPGFPMPCDPNMYGPPMGPMGMAGPPPNQWNRGGGWQGGRPFMGPMNMPQKFQKGVCHHFAKFGNCARGSSCRFMHPN